MSSSLSETLCGYITPNLVKVDGTDIPSFATGGITNKFSNNDVTGNITISDTTTPLKKYIKDKGAITLLLTTGTSVKTITDYFIANRATYSTEFDTTNTGGQVNYGNVLTALLNDGMLLKQTDLYNPATDTQAGSQSLLYLTMLGQTTTLTADQQTLKTSLEQRNLKFFAAFLLEYCFYRARYLVLLTKYYTTLTDTTTTTYSGFDSLFSTTSGAANSKAGASPTKSEFLTALAYHMAILNKRLYDMRQLLVSINEFYRGILLNIQNALNSASAPGSTADLQNKIVALKASAKESKVMQTEAEFRKAAMDYNQEKNRYATMLLGLYAILNISALAMIYKLR